MDSKATWRSATLGAPRTLELSGGSIDVHEAGEGPPIVLLHGVLVNANLWRGVVPALSGSHRCVTLDLPLGSHARPCGGDDLTPPGLANLVADAIEQLELGPVTLVGNDTGGAISQVLAARRPELIDRLVLSSCDAYELFFPKLFSYLKLVGRFPGIIPGAFGGMRLPAMRRLPIAFGRLTKRPIDRQAEDTYVLPVLQAKAVRTELGAVLRGVDSSHTLEAAERLKSFDRPVLLAWSADDRVFPRRLAERLRDDLPDARLELVEDSYAFSPEDNPGALAALIAEFARPSGGETAQQPSSTDA